MIQWLEAQKKENPQTRLAEAISNRLKALRWVLGQGTGLLLSHGEAEFLRKEK